MPTSAKSGRSLLAAFLAVVLCGALASASSYLKTTLKDLTVRSAAVAEVQVLDKQFPQMLPGQNFPRTNIEMKLLRTMKGNLPDNFLVDIPGGINGDVVSYVADGPEFRKGERAIVFIKEAEGKLMVQDLGLGKFNIVQRDGKDFVESPLCPRAIKPASTATDDLEASLLTKSIPYETFCTLVSSYASGKAPAEDVAALAAALPNAGINHHSEPAVLADARNLQIAKSRSRGWMYMLTATLAVALLSVLWIAHRRRNRAAALSTKTIAMLLGAALVGGSGLGMATHAFVTFDQKTIWNLDKALNGKVANQKIIWRQSTPSASNGAVFSSVQGSFDKWATVAGSRLGFTAGGSTAVTANISTDAENIVAWSTTPSNDFSKGTLAICFSSFTVGAGSSFVDGDIIFNDRDFQWGAGGQGNAASVSLHEIGHFIGLNHTTDRATVMFPFDGGITSLTGDEIAAAQALYPGTGGAAPAAPPAGGPSVAVTASPTSGVPSLNVSFTGTATPGTGGAISSFAWDFGDGQKGTGANISHTYTGFGIFTASLTVTDASAKTAVATVTINLGTQGQAQKGAFKLNFKSLGKDSFSATIFSENLIGFKDAKGAGKNTQGFINIGDQSWQFDYNTEKAKSFNKDGPKISVSDKKGTVSVSIKNADLRDVLGGHGAENEDTAGETVSVPVVIWFGDGTNTFIFGDVDFSYKAAADKNGSGKF